MRAVYLILVGVLWFVLPLNVFGQCMTENTISREKIIPHKTVWLSDKDISDELTIPNESMDIPYDDIQSVIDETLQETTNIFFSEIVDMFLSGNLLDAVKMSGQLIYDRTIAEIQTSLKTMLQLMGIALIAAVFANLSSAFAQKFVSESGFYLTYMMMAVMLTASFAGAVTVTQNILERLTDLMKAIVPVYTTVVTYSIGVTTGNIWYQFLMLLIVVVDWFLAGIVMRVVKIYVVLVMVNQIASQDYFSKMTDLLRGAIHWSLKTILVVTLGLNVIQNMVLPAYDAVKNGWVTKLASAIPGIGTTFGMAAQKALASAVLLKNAIGAAGVVILCMACMWPMLQLLLLTLMYKLLEALIQPVTDQRLLVCIHAVGEGIYMLCKCAATVLLLFIISLAMMATFSGGLNI